MAINNDGSLYAVIDNTSAQVAVHAINNPGSVVVFNSLPHAATAGYGRKDLRHLCFARRGSGETLLITGTGLYDVIEISTFGVFMRGMTVTPIIGSAMGIAYTPFGNIIAVTLVHTHGAGDVVFVNYDTGNVLRSIKHSWMPGGVAFSSNGEHLFISPMSRLTPYGDSSVPVSQFTRDCVAFTYVRDHAFELGRGRLGYTSILCEDADTVVLSCKTGPRTSILLYVDVKTETIERTVAVHAGVLAMARLGNAICCRPFTGSLLVVANEWHGSLRGVWVTVCALGNGD